LAGATIVAVATKGEEMETGAGEYDACVGFLQNQLSDAAVAENFLGGCVECRYSLPLSPKQHRMYVTLHIPLVSCLSVLFHIVLS
jgi:hypothetical protein